MRLFLPGQSDPLTGTETTQSGEPFSAFLPLSKAAAYQVGFSNVLVQELRGALFSIAVYEAVSDAAQLIEVCSPGPLLSLVFTLCGFLTIQQQFRSPVIQEEGRYSLWYCPARERIKLTVARGQTIVLRIDYDAGTFAELSEDYPVVQSLLRRAREQSVLGRQLPGAAIDAFIHWNIQQIFEYGQTKSERGLFIHSRSIDLLRYYVHSLNPVQSTASAESHHLAAQLAAVAGYIDLHLDAPLSKVTLARTHGISVRSLERHFGQHYLESIGKFILHRRMMKAKLLLTETSLPVLRIAMMVGYNELPNFTRAFKNYYGYPPSRIRH